MASPTATMPTRTFTNATDGDDAIPDEDSSEVTKLFHERLQAWKHACGYLEDYVQATEKLHASNAKDYEKVLKTVNSPLKEAHHFEQNAGGISELFENLRTNTIGLTNSSNELAKTLKTAVLPIFERLHHEIKNKTKELDKGAGKGAKAVDKARDVSQKHIELLGQRTATFGATAGSIKANEDPYVLQRQVYHRLNKQVNEENNNRDDLIAVQNNFLTFEDHVVKSFQNGIGQFNMVIANHTEQIRNMYGDVATKAQAIRPDFEWNGFLRRNANILIDPAAPKRAVENIAFNNQDHPSTRPLIAGTLERKGKMFKSYNTGFYAVTPTKYLHEFKTDDDFAKDPTPENSLYLPDCLIGAVDGLKFNVRGKDASKGTIGNKFSMSHEFGFKAHSPEDARKWHEVISSVAGQTTNELPDSAPGSPAISGKEATSPVSAASPTAATATTGTVHPAAETAAPAATTGTTAPATTAGTTAPVAAAGTGAPVATAGTTPVTAAAPPVQNA